MPNLPNHHDLDVRDFCRRVLLELDQGPTFGGPQEELVASAALVIGTYAPHTNSLWPRGTVPEFELLREVAALLICESRELCDYGTLRDMLRELYLALQNTDIDEGLPSPQERLVQTTAYSFIRAAVFDFEQRIEREKSEKLIR